MQRNDIIIAKDENSLELTAEELQQGILASLDTSVQTRAEWQRKQKQLATYLHEKQDYSLGNFSHGWIGNYRDIPDHEWELCTMIRPQKRLQRNEALTDPEFQTRIVISNHWKDGEYVIIQWTAGCVNTQVERKMLKNLSQEQKAIWSMTFTTQAYDTILVKYWVLMHQIQLKELKKYVTGFLLNLFTKQVRCTIKCNDLTKKVTPKEMQKKLKARFLK
jgi:hypothetical protein